MDSANICVGNGRTDRVSIRIFVSDNINLVFSFHKYLFSCSPGFYCNIALIFLSVNSFLWYTVGKSLCAPCFHAAGSQQKIIKRGEEYVR